MSEETLSSLGAHPSPQRRSLAAMGQPHHALHQTPGVQMRPVRQSRSHPVTGAEAAALNALGNPPPEVRAQLAELLNQQRLFLAVKDKEPDQLTDEEIFALCFHGGVPVHVNLNPDGAYDFEVSCEITITKAQGRFQIVMGKTKATRVI